VGLDGLDVVECRGQGLVGAGERVLLGGHALRPPLADDLVEDDQVDEEVVVDQVEQELGQLFGMLRGRFYESVSAVIYGQNLERVK
jgi:hypothetical protein